MVYITVRQPPMYRQMTLEELLFNPNPEPALLSANVSNTKTFAVESPSPRVLSTVRVDKLISVLEQFNASTEHLRQQQPRESLYNTFYIPKKSGGLRRIDAPNPELMDALRRLKTIFVTDFHALYHTSAFAYIEHRSTVDCMKRHQANESKWFAKYDLHNFFGSTTLDFVLSMLAQVFPFSEVVKVPRGLEALRTALDLGFLNGGLPQGTPLSPTLTNIMMIPVDFKLANTLRDFTGQRMIYTRYADDFQISCRYGFDFRAVERLLTETLASFGAPFRLNAEKTRYGSSAGRNWNLGLMLNKDNTLTVGHRKKRQLQAMLSSYILDRQHGISWDRQDLQTMDGYRNYYRMVEGETIDRIVEHLNRKFGVNVMEMIAADLAS